MELLSKLFCKPPFTSTCDFFVTKTFAVLQMFAVWHYKIRNWIFSYAHRDDLVPFILPGISLGKLDLKQLRRDAFNFGHTIILYVYNATVPCPYLFEVFYKYH